MFHLHSRHSETVSAREHGRGVGSELSSAKKVLPSTGDASCPSLRMQLVFYLSTLGTS
jgi:hypothetical protein